MKRPELLAQRQFHNQNTPNLQQHCRKNLKFHNFTTTTLQVETAPCLQTLVKCTKAYGFLSHPVYTEESVTAAKMLNILK
jgi:hypothetical protein